VKKLLQFTQRITKKKLAGIGKPMVPNIGGLANIDPLVICCPETKLYIRVERNRNMQKSTRAVVLKVADTHFKKLSFYNFPKF
jgi:hypothetical protein